MNDDCPYLLAAQYRSGFTIFVEFNTGDAGELDFTEIIKQHAAAAPLRDQKMFSEFYLDSWPTLAWPCGFDIAPEALLNRLKTSSSA